MSVSLRKLPTKNLKPFYMQTFINCHSAPSEREEESFSFSVEEAHSKWVEELEIEHELFGGIGTEPCTLKRYNHHWNIFLHINQCPGTMFLSGCLLPCNCWKPRLWTYLPGHYESPWKSRLRLNPVRYRFGRNNVQAKLSQVKIHRWNWTCNLKPLEK